jgi:hypothetical protein
MNIINMTNGGEKSESESELPSTSTLIIPGIQSPSEPPRGMRAPNRGKGDEARTKTSKQQGGKYKKRKYKKSRKTNRRRKISKRSKRSKRSKHL